jgi:hypothetical protein
MNTQPTPRTDEAAVDVWRKSNGERMETSSDKVDADFARCLERELNEARFDLDFSRRLADWQSKTIDDLTAQRDEVREYADKLAEGLPDGMLPKDVEVLREANLGLATELATVTAQRDMLVEALEIAANRFRHPEFGCNWEDASEEIESALQSLTQKAEP